MGSKSKILALMLVFLFLASIVILPSAKSQNSLPQVTILPDGSVNGTSHIHRSGNTYTLTANLNTSITIEKDNIVLNGAGFILQGSENFTQNEIAVSLTNRTNDVVENLNITGYDVAIALYNSSRCTVSGNKIYGNNSNGISLTNSSNDWIKQNSVEDTQNTAVSLNNANDTIVSENRIINSLANGIWINNYGNSSNIISGNEVSEGGGIYIDSSNNIIIGNNINDSSVQTDFLFSNGTNDPSNNFFTENNFTNCGTAALVLGGNNTFFKNNFINNYAVVLCYVIAPNDVFYDNNCINITEPDTQAWMYSVPSSPSWDNGTLGNYWSDYTAKYPTAKEVNNTGTYDIPYLITETTTYINDHNYYFYDNHPLVSPVDVSFNVTEVPSWVTPTPANQQVTNSYVAVVVIVVFLAAAFSSLLLYRRHKKTANLDK